MLTSYIQLGNAPSTFTTWKISWKIIILFLKFWLNLPVSHQYLSFLIQKTINYQLNFINIYKMIQTSCFSLHQFWEFLCLLKNLFHPNYQKFKYNLKSLVLFLLISLESIVMTPVSFLVLLICILSFLFDQPGQYFINFISLFREPTFGLVHFLFLRCFLVFKFIDIYLKYFHYLYIKFVFLYFPKVRRLNKQL